MDFKQAISYIHATDRFGSVLGLKTMSSLMERLGNPQKQLKFVHVAGTNGKGSTVCFLSNILTEAGYKTGVYTSPYIYQFNERIKIDNVEISDEELAQTTTIVKDKIDEMVAQGETHPTEFEIVTAIAFVYFSNKKCDIVVLEVGLGGRLDATNVIDCPLLSIITTLSFDHMLYLGDTMPQIAYEKAGIIKQNGEVLAYEQSAQCISVLEEVCVEKSANLTVLEFETLKIDSFNLEFQTFSVYDITNIKISLLGEHQPKNATLAIKAALILNKKGLNITRAHILKGLEVARWAGRFEVLQTNPPLIVDGAHNDQGAQMLAQNLKTYFPNVKITFIVGVLKDKDYKNMFLHCLPIAKQFLTITPNNPRALSAEELATFLNSADPISNSNIAKSFETTADALKFALVNCDEKDVICVFGSLYFLAEINNFCL